MDRVLGSARYTTCLPTEQQLLFPAHPCRPSAPCCRPACCVWPAICAQTDSPGWRRIPGSIWPKHNKYWNLNHFFFDLLFDQRGLTSLYYLRESLIFCDRSLGVVDDSEAGYGWTAGQTKPNVPLPDEASDVEQHDADAHPPWNISLGWSGPYVRKLYGLSKAITLQVIASHFWMSWHLLFMLHISRSSFNL